MIEMVSSFPKWHGIIYSILVKQYKLDMLEKIVAPRILSDRAIKKTTGSYVRIQELKPESRKIDPVASIAAYGDLMFSGVMGYSRKVKESRGRLLGKAGSFTILLPIDRDIWRGNLKKPYFACPGSSLSGTWIYLVTAAYLIVEEASRRGDVVNLIASTGEHDRLNPDIPVKPKAPVEYALIDIFGRSLPKNTEGDYYDPFNKKGL